MSQQQQQQEVNMREVIEGWKEKSKKTFALEQLKRMISEVNKKPTDYHPSDFFPKLPSSYTATSSSDEPTIENIRNISKRRLEYSQASTSTTTKNLNISVSKLNTDKENQPASIPSSQINITRCIVEEAEHEMPKSPFKPSSKTRRSTAGPLSSKENITPLVASPIVVEKLKKAESKISEISIVNEIAEDNYALEEEFEELKQPKSSTLLEKIRNKMSSTSNNLEVSIQQSRTPLGKLKSVSSAKKTFSPAKEAFNNSIKRKSNNLSLLTEAPFDLENDEVVVGSGELYQASISSNQTQSRHEPKPKSKSSIKITKIPKPVEVASNNKTLTKSQSTASLSQPTVNEPIKEINVDLGLSKKLKSSASVSSLTNKQKINLNQPENDSKDEQELLEQQNNKFIRRSLMKSSTLSLTTNTTVNTSSAPANQPSSHIFKSSKQLAKLSQVPPVPLFPTKKAKTKPSYENVQVEVFADAEPEPIVVETKKTSKNALKDIGNERETRRTTRSRESPVKRTRSSAVSRAPVSATSNKENIKQKPAKSKKTTQVVCEEEENGPRRSKRARHDPTCVAVYDYVPVIDFNGVQTLCLQMVGTKPRTSLFKKGVRDLYYNIKPKKNKKRAPKSPKQKENDSRTTHKKKTKEVRVEKLKKVKPSKKEAKKKSIEPITDISSQQEDFQAESVPEMEEYVPVVENSPRNEIDKIRRSSQISASNDSIDFSDVSESKINTSQESIVLHEANNSKETQQNLFCFKKNLESRAYSEYLPGCGMLVFSNLDGILSLEKNATTKTGDHETLVTYVVQKGECLFSLNGCVSRHSQADIIKIPQNVRYKIKNVSNKSKAYLYFMFSS